MGKERLSYNQIRDIKSNLDKLIDTMENELNESKNLIISIEEDGGLKSDIASVTMVDSYNSFAATFVPYIAEVKNFSDFLQSILVASYIQSDQELAKIWLHVKELWENAQIKKV